MTMTVFAPEHLHTVVSGRWLATPPAASRCDGVGIDTRQDLTGRIFFAIAGENHDGHDYLDSAAKGGAAVLVVHREPKHCPPDVGVLRVDDTRRAMGRLAAHHRRTLEDTTVIAITGSAGKTTTKAMLEAVLSSTMRGTCASKSFNNDIGVPLTILGATPRDQYLLLEIGTNAPGEIAALAEIAQPNIGIITMIGRSHLAGLGSVEQVAQEKTSLLEHLAPPNAATRSFAVLNADSPYLQPYITEQSMTFGESQSAGVRLTGHGQEEGQWWFEVNASQRFNLGLPGRHNAINALVAVTVGRYMGIQDATISHALQHMQPADMRFVSQQWRGMTVYNDAYNANPDSMIASLDTFADLTHDASRRVVILGEMGELGDHAVALHEEVGRHLAKVQHRCPIAQIILIGPLTQHIASQLQGPAAQFTALNDEAITEIHSVLQSGDSVLLKASRAGALERLLQPTQALTSHS